MIVNPQRFIGGVVVGVMLSYKFGFFYGALFLFVGLYVESFIKDR